VAAEVIAQERSDAVELPAETFRVVRVAREREVRCVARPSIFVGGSVDRNLYGTLGALVFGADSYFLEEEGVGPVVAAEEGAEGGGGDGREDWRGLGAVGAFSRGGGDAGTWEEGCYGLCGLDEGGDAVDVPGEDANVVGGTVR